MAVSGYSKQKLTEVVLGKAAESEPVPEVLAEWIARSRREFAE
jgi:hypothetical protein